MEFNNIQEYSDYFEQVKEITNNYFDKYKSELKIPENFEGSFRNAFQHAFGTVIIAQELGIDDALFLCYAKEIRTKQGEIDAHKNGRSDKEALEIVIGDTNRVCRLGLTAFSKIFDFVKNVWFPITQQ